MTQLLRGATVGPSLREGSVRLRLRKTTTEARTEGRPGPVLANKQPGRVFWFWPTAPQNHSMTERRQTSPPRRGGPTVNSPGGRSRPRNSAVRKKTPDLRRAFRRFVKPCSTRYSAGETACSSRSKRAWRSWIVWSRSESSSFRPLIAARATPERSFRAMLLSPW